MTLTNDITQIKNLLDYIGADSVKVPYLYSNLMIYRPDNSNIKIWADLTDNEINGIFLLYHTCLHFYSKNLDYPIDEILKKIDTLSPQVLTFDEKTGKRIINTLPSNYYSDRGFIGNMKGVSCCYSDLVTEADYESLKEVVDLLLEDQIYKKVYTFNSLYQQIEERFLAGFGKIFIIKEDSKIVAATCINAANDKFIFEGGLIVHPSQRGNGFATILLKHLWQYAKDQNKFCLCYIEEDNTVSYNLHKKLGANLSNKIYKFISNQKP